MSLEWTRESPPHWDDRKREIVGAAPAGIFDLGPFAAGDPLPGDWWHVTDGDQIVGYGWMDCTWGDAEMLLAVAPEAQGRGVGTFILDRLEQEAAGRGVNYLHNLVRTTHPDRERITAWLRGRRFEPEHDDDRLRRRVHARAET